jgi:hypothetical protein
MYLWNMDIGMSELFYSDLVLFFSMKCDASLLRTDSNLFRIRHLGELGRVGPSRAGGNS